MESVKNISSSYLHSSEELDEMIKISKVCSPKLIHIIYKSFGVDYVLSQEEFDYIENYPCFNVNDILKKFGIKKGLSKGFYRPNSHFLKDFIVRTYKEQIGEIEKKLEQEGLGVKNTNGKNYTTMISLSHKRRGEILSELDEKFFNSLKQVSKGIADNIALLLMN